MLTVVTEDPQREQWTLLSQYMYPENVGRLRAHPVERDRHAAAAFVAASIRQAREYFQLGAEADREVAPVLLYYGAVNLLIGAAAFQRGVKPEINGHGMYLQLGSTGRVADAVVVTRDSAGGTLNYLLNVLRHGNNTLTPPRPAALSRIFAGIADTHEVFALAYPEVSPSVMPITPVRRDELTYYRIPRNALAPHGGIENGLASIHRSARWFCDPVVTEQFVVLYPQMDADHDVVRSVLGSSFLALKDAQLGILPQGILYVMALFALSSLSRYWPEEWISFIRNDQTGERLFVEQLMIMSGRVLPNIALSLLRGEEIRFVFPSREARGIGDLTTEDLDNRINDRVDAQLRRRSE